MSKPIIVIDVDDVLLPHFGCLIAWYNAEYGTNVTMAINHSVDVMAWGADSIEEAVHRVHRYFETDTFKNEKPYDEAGPALTELGQNYELVIITGRDEAIEDITRDWLQTYFPDVFKEVHFTSLYSLVGKSRSKAEVTALLNADYFIDDNLPAVTEVAASGVPSLLFGDYPWNETDSLPGNVTRVADWPAVLKYFDGSAQG